MNWGFLAYCVLLTVRLTGFIRYDMKKETEKFTGVLSSFVVIGTELCVVLWAMHWQVR